MKQNLEIEFKTFITKEKYKELLNEFGLENEIFAQTNHYFDTSNMDISNNKTVLRIRQKGNIYKLTSKVSNGDGDLESHVDLSVAQADEMLRNGFDGNIINLPYTVHKICELTTHRAKIDYKCGTLFFDKSSYYGTIDFEIEFEVDDIVEGEKVFKEFLQEYNIPYLKSIRKSFRAYEQLKKL